MKVLQVLGSLTFVVNGIDWTLIEPSMVVRAQLNLDFGWMLMVLLILILINGVDGLHCSALVPGLLEKGVRVILVFFIHLICES